MYCCGLQLPQVRGISHAPELAQACATADRSPARSTKKARVACSLRSFSATPDASMITQRGSGASVSAHAACFLLLFARVSSHGYAVTHSLHTCPQVDSRPHHHPLRQQPLRLCAVSCRKRSEGRSGCDGRMPSRSIIC